MSFPSRESVWTTSGPAGSALGRSGRGNDSRSPLPWNVWAWRLALWARKIEGWHSAHRCEAHVRGVLECLGMGCAEVADARERRRRRGQIMLLEGGATQEPVRLRVARPRGQEGVEVHARLGRLPGPQERLDQPLADLVRRSLLDADESWVASQGRTEGLGGRGRVPLAEPHQAEQDESPGFPTRRLGQSPGLLTGLGQAVGSTVEPDRLQQTLGVAGVDPQGSIQPIASLCEHPFGDQSTADQEIVLCLETVGVEALVDRSRELISAQPRLGASQELHRLFPAGLRPEDVPSPGRRRTPVALLIVTRGAGQRVGLQERPSGPGPEREEQQQTRAFGHPTRDTSQGASIGGSPPAVARHPTTPPGHGAVSV